VKMPVPGKRKRRNRTSLMTALAAGFGNSQPGGHK